MPSAALRNFSSGTFRVETPAARAVGSVFLWILFFPLYLTSRAN